MFHRSSIFVLIYHWISELLLLFLLFLPFLYFFEQTPYYGRYLLILTISTIFFALLTKYSQTYGPYLFMAPILFFLFYSFQFSLTISIIFSYVFVWRAIYLRKEEVSQREGQYFLSGLLLTTINVFFFQDIQVFLYGLLLFLVLIFGHLLKHLLFAEQNIRMHFKNPLSLWIFVAFFLSSIIFYYLFQPVRWLLAQIWLVFSKGIANIGGILVYGLEYIELEFFREEEKEQQRNDGVEEFSDVVQPVSFDHWKLILQIVLGLVVVLLCAFLLWKIVQLFRRRFSLAPNEQTLPHRVIEKMEATRSKRRSLLHRPTHPLRKIVYDFERKVAHTKARRNDFETIEQWFNRLGFKEDLALYQRLRYGQETVEKAEIIAFREKIQHLEEKVLKELSKSADS